MVGFILLTSDLVFIISTDFSVLAYFKCLMESSGLKQVVVQGS